MAPLRTHRKNTIPTKDACDMQLIRKCTDTISMGGNQETQPFLFLILLKFVVSNRATKLIGKIVDQNAIHKINGMFILVWLASKKEWEITHKLRALLEFGAFDMTF